MDATLINFWIILVLTLLLGYCLGIYSKFERTDIAKATQDIKQQIISATHPKPKIKVGAIERPSARDLYLKDNPKLAEEEAVMDQAFRAAGADKV